MLTAWLVTDKNTPAQLTQLPEDTLTGDTLVRVHSSSLNYKDALALHGRPGVLRTYPLIAGIDLTGEVIETSHEAWKPGDLVTLNGAGLGESYHGGLATLARVRGRDLVAVPEAFTATQASAIGTAGVTARLAITALEGNGLIPEDQPVLVTGANGGVGSLAIALLAAQGYEVTAATGRPEDLGDRLTALGASQVIHRDELLSTRRPLSSERWSGVIDGLGGDYLAGALAGVCQDGAVAAYGLAASAQLPTSVLPFILRGVSLLGINSVGVSAGMRQMTWDYLARDLSGELLDSLTVTVGLDQAQEAASELLAGRGLGRTVVLAS